MYLYNLYMYMCMYVCVVFVCVYIHFTILAS